MEKEKYSIDDIEVGDEIIFDDQHPVSHNLFWKVVKKISKSKLVVEIREMGFAEKFSIDVNAVINIQKNDCYLQNAF